MFSPKPLLIAFLVATIAIVAVWINHLRGQGGAYRDLAFHGGESCTKLDGYIGAEDIVIDHARGLAYISSDDRRATLAGTPVPGHIFVLDLTDVTAAPQAIAIGLESFHPHGIDLWVGEDGTRHLMVINHAADGERVEILELGAQGKTVTHNRTVTDPAIISPNDVAAVGPEQFYLTNDVGDKGTLARLGQMLQISSTANLIYFDGTAARVEQGNFLLANGVSAHPDGKTVVMTEFYGQSLWLFDRDAETNALSGRDVIGLPTHLDNIAFAPDGSIWIGAQPNAIAMLGHAMDADKKSPSQILRITLNAEGPGGRVDEPYLEDGTQLSATSVGAPYTAAGGNTRLLIGSIFEPHILDCAIGD